MKTEDHDEEAGVKSLFDELETRVIARLARSAQCHNWAAPPTSAEGDYSEEGWDVWNIGSGTSEAETKPKPI